MAVINRPKSAGIAQPPPPRSLDRRIDQGEAGCSPLVSEIEHLREPAPPAPATAPTVVAIVVARVAAGAAAEEATIVVTGVAARAGLPETGVPHILASARDARWLYRIVEPGISIDQVIELAT